jgi:hypothetical protein
MPRPSDPDLQPATGPYPKPLEPSSHFHHVFL